VVANVPEGMFGCLVGLITRCQPRVKKRYFELLWQGYKGAAAARTFCHTCHQVDGLSGFRSRSGTVVRPRVSNEDLRCHGGRRSGPGALERLYGNC